MSVIDSSSDGGEVAAIEKVASSYESPATLDEINQKLDLLIDMQRQALREQRDAEKAD